MEQAAKKGSENAQRELQQPEPPECMEYLADWAFALYGRSGASMEGLAPLSFQTVEAWGRLMGIEPDPLEVQALMVLDAVIRKPETEEVAEAEVEEADTSWPSRD